MKFKEISIYPTIKKDIAIMPHLMYNREKERRMRYAFQKKDRKILQLLHAWDKTGRGTGTLRQTRCGKCLFQVQKVHLRSLQAHPVKAKGFGFYEIRSRRLQPVCVASMIFQSASIIHVTQAAPAMVISSVFSLINSMRRAKIRRTTASSRPL